MKKTLSLFTLLIISLFANNCLAQSNDPLNTHEGWSTESEEVISKKKNNTNNTNNTNNNTATVNVTKNSCKITNACPEKISVELVSLIGNRASQYVEITIKFINHDVNEKMSIKDFVAYNEEGNEFSDYYPVYGISTFTDVPVKASWKFGKMLPNKNSKIPAMSFRIGDCTIEMRDVVIEWM